MKGLILWMASVLCVEKDLIQSSQNQNIIAVHHAKAWLKLDGILPGSAQYVANNMIVKTESNITVVKPVRK